MELTNKQKRIVKETIKSLKEEQNNSDFESSHINADAYICDLLIYLGLDKVVEEYKKVNKWYS